MKFILIIRENLNIEHSREELSKIIELHRAWYMTLSAAGKAIDGNGLSNEGFLLEHINSTISVGPIQNKLG